MMKVSSITAKVLIILGGAVPLGAESNAAGVDLLYCPSERGGGGYTYKFTLTKTKEIAGTDSLHMAWIVFAASGRDAPDTAKGIDSWRANPDDSIPPPPYSGFANTYGPISGPTLYHHYEQFSSKNVGDSLSWTIVGDNVVPNGNLYWVFIRGTWPGKEIFMEAKLWCPPTSAPTGRPTPAPSPLPSSAPSISTVPSSNPSVSPAPTLLNPAGVDLYYCATGKSGGLFEYEFSLEQTYPINENDYMADIVFGATGADAPSNAEGLEMWWQSSDAPRPFTGYDRMSGHFIGATLAPAWTEWNPSGVGDSLTWKGDAENFVAAGNLYWAFLDGTFPNKRNFIAAIERCPVSTEAPSSSPSISAAPTELPLSPDSTCGPGLYRCHPGYCCSQWGSCGDTYQHCGIGCQSDYGECYGLSTDDKCGDSTQQLCHPGHCCSEYDWCGKKDSADHCGVGCQIFYGDCYLLSTDWKCGMESKQRCHPGYCCSQGGECGVSEDYCGTGCQALFGDCN